MENFQKGREGKEKKLFRNFHNEKSRGVIKAHGSGAIIPFLNTLMAWDGWGCVSGTCSDPA